MANIWIVLQHRDGKLHRMAREAIAAGQQLASATGGQAAAVVLGDSVDEVAAEAAGFELEAVFTAKAAALADYTPGGYCGALAPAIQAATPDLVIFPHTYQTVDFMARLAQEVDAAVVPEITAFEHGDEGLVYRRPILGGKLQARVRTRGDGPVFVSVQSAAFSADGAVAGSAALAELPGDRSALAADREILEVEQVGDDQVDLTKADAIVAIGRGVGGEDKIGPLRDLAEVLGADIGASRPVIDNGWLKDAEGNVERERQIGSSGQTVAPKLYIAAGISGAIQHLVGMKGSSCVVAINKDATAPIFSVADYGLVGDLHEIVPALTAAIREVKG